MFKKTIKLPKKPLKSAHPKICLLLQVMKSYLENIRQLTDNSSENAESKSFRFLIDEK